MRTDVKLGLVASVVCIGLGSWYFFDQPELGQSIPIEPHESVAADGGGLKVLPPETVAPPRENGAANPQALTGVGTDNPTDAGSSEAATTDHQTTADAGEDTSDDTNLGELFTIGARGNSGDAAEDEHAAQPERPTAQTFRKPTPTKRKDAPDTDRSAATEREQTAPSKQPETSTPAPTSVPTGPFVTHTVTTGDTLIGLARMYFGDERFMVVIRAANPQVRDWGTLTVDQKLRIPEDADLPVSPAQEAAKPKNRSIPKSVTIESGDSLYSIAANVYGDGTAWAFIYERNRERIGDDPAALKVGMVLQLPTLKELESMRKSKKANPVP